MIEDSEYLGLIDDEWLFSQDANEGHWVVVLIGYRVYRLDALGGSPVLVAFVPSDTLSATIDGLLADSEAFYYINAINSCQVESIVSSSVRLRRVAVDSAGLLIPPAPNPPYALTLTLGAGGLVTASWEHTNTNGEADAASFNVYVATGAAAFDFNTPAHNVSLPVRSASLGTFPEGTVVRVVVRAVTSADDGSVQETNTTETTATASADPPVAPASIALI